MFQVKMFRTRSRNSMESSINGFLKENKDEIESIIDIKLMMTPIGKDQSATASEYLATVIYKEKE